jgi:capsular polysaccharide transport system permease protein
MSEGDGRPTAKSGRPEPIGRTEARGRRAQPGHDGSGGSGRSLPSRAVRVIESAESGTAPRSRRMASQLPRTSRARAPQRNRSALAVPPQVQGGGATALSYSPASQVTPAAWAIETLRIDIEAANRKRRRGFILRMLVFVLLPTALMAAYVYLYASPRFVSEFQITYQSTSQSSAGGSSSLLGSLLGASTGGSMVDMSRVLTSYLTSETILHKINSELNLRQHYSNPRIDWPDRLSPKASAEDFLSYFNRRVAVDDMLGGYVVVDVEAFDPKFAYAVAKAMVAACDEMVENLTTRARQEEVRVAEAELNKTQDRLVKATLAITNFRNEHVDFNPTTMALQLDSVVGALESQLAQARATLTSDRTFLAERAPQIITLKSQIAGLEKQIEAEKLRLANKVDDSSDSVSPQSGGAPADQKPYSKLVAEWTSLELEHKFASDSYVSAKSAYDLARVDAERKENYVESFVKPSLPQRSTSPNPWRYILSAFIISIISYASLSLLIGTFRDKAGR